jgi:hypothetical protein
MRVGPQDAIHNMPTRESDYGGRNVCSCAALCPRWGSPMWATELSSNRNLEEVDSREMELKCKCRWTDVVFGAQREASPSGFSSGVWGLFFISVTLTKTPAQVKYTHAGNGQRVFCWDLLRLFWAISTISRQRKWLICQIDMAWKCCQVIKLRLLV